MGDLKDSAIKITMIPQNGEIKMMDRRIYKKIICSCMDCPARSRVYTNTSDGAGKMESMCMEYEQPIDNKHLDLKTRMFNFPDFCKLKKER
jgi:hypothetical protein